MLAPRISRGRASGLGSVRISTTATAAKTTGSANTAEPMNVRSTMSTQAPTGRAASNQELAAITTARPSSTSANPSRRCLGSMSRARPIDRAALPVPRAAISQVARMARPHVTPVATSSDWLRRLAGLLTRLRGAAGRPPRGPLARDGAFDLLVRFPERAAVLLGMTPRVVAIAPHSPSATRVTKVCQFGDLPALPCRNGRNHCFSAHSGLADSQQGPLRRLHRHRDRRISSHLEPERRLLRPPRELSRRVPQRLESHARVEVADGRYPALLPRRRGADGDRGQKA